MADASKTQNLANHARYVPGFHFATGSIDIIIVLFALYRLATLRTSGDVLMFLVAVALLAHFVYLRQFPLAVQDRVIQLEERLRIERLLPGDGRALAEALSPSQLIALRFASDAELPALAKRVRDERIDTRGAVKALITNWRADDRRA